MRQRLEAASEAKRSDKLLALSFSCVTPKLSKPKNPPRSGRIARRIHEQRDAVLLSAGERGRLRRVVGNLLGEELGHVLLLYCGEHWSVEECEETPTVVDDPGVMVLAPRPGCRAFSQRFQF